MSPTTLLITTAMVTLSAAVLSSLARGLAALAGGDPLARLRPVAGWLVLAAATILTLALGWRAIDAGRAPWSNLHEVSAAFALGVLLAYLALARRLAITALAPGVALLAAGLLGIGLGQPDSVRPLVPALQAPLLLTIHVGAAIAAYAIGGLAFLAATAEIVQRRAGDRLGFLPGAEACRTAAHRAALLAFPVLTAAIVLGSVWANLAWRAYWSNDPKELAAAATWLVYGGYLHVAGRRDRWGAAAPWLLVLGFALVLFTWLAAGLLFVGRHSYAGA
ncbi:MAG TPA: cytochrome c biogenesis protein CcsA [Candidatus Limnocylindria bacterium]|nr:cytochrome c biogenesis protein CcsA [Candidatus Limnocylindria bacterium]